MTARPASAALPWLVAEETAEPLLQPFRTLRYAPDVGSLDDLVAPPVGAIREQRRATLLARHAANVSHALELGEPARAAAIWRRWRRDGVLVRDDEPAAWFVEEVFFDSSGVERRRNGVLAHLRVEPHRRGFVLAHETTGAPGRRLWREHMRRLRACVAPLLVLHGGPSSRPPAREPDLEAACDGHRARAWRVTDPGGLMALLGSMKTPLVIADGHHRYQAAVQLGATARPPRALLAHVVSARDPGVEACALHRLAITSRLPRPLGFRRAPLRGGAREAVAVLERLQLPASALVFLRAGAAELLVGDGEGAGGPLENDLTTVSRLGLPPLAVTARLDEVEDFVAAVPDALAILLRRPKVEQVVAVARAGRTLPQKSTSFEPKPLCGLVFSAFDG